MSGLTYSAGLGIVRRSDGAWRVAQAESPELDVGGHVRLGGTMAEAERDAKRVCEKYAIAYLGELATTGGLQPLGGPARL